MERNDVGREQTITKKHTLLLKKTSAPRERKKKQQQQQKHHHHHTIPTVNTAVTAFVFLYYKIYIILCDKQHMFRPETIITSLFVSWCWHYCMYCPMSSAFNPFSFSLTLTLSWLSLPLIFRFKTILLFFFL